jgi:hypothetical protein
MNCVEFQRAVGSEPRAHTAELARHAVECAVCSRYRAELQHMDQLIYRTLHVVGATNRVSAVPRSRSLPRLARAASVVLACALAVLWLATPRATLAQQLVGHMGHEPHALVRTDAAVNAAVLESVLARSGLRLRQRADGISYAMSCRFRGHSVPHLVVQSDEGPVTVLLLTEEAGVKRREIFDEGGFRGVILPAPRGAVAVLARHAHADHIARDVLQAIDYRR